MRHPCSINTHTHGTTRARGKQNGLPPLVGGLVWLPLLEELYLSPVVRGREKAVALPSRQMQGESRQSGHCCRRKGTASFRDHFERGADLRVPACRHCRQKMSKGYFWDYCNTRNLLKHLSCSIWPLKNPSSPPHLALVTWVLGSFNLG